MTKVGCIIAIGLGLYSAYCMGILKGMKTNAVILTNGAIGATYVG